MTTPPPTREERLERALRDLIEIDDYERFCGATNYESGSPNGKAWKRARLALHPAADGEETKP